jgi:hypothetical protein
VLTWSVTGALRVSLLLLIALPVVVEGCIWNGVKPFVQTTSRYWWADGGVVTPPAGQWTCVTLDIDNPAFSRQQYDPSDIQILGFELQTMAAGRVYIDQVAY